MGTIINGNKWSGACVNGNIVSGLVKNGAVFFRAIYEEYVVNLQYFNKTALDLNEDRAFCKADDTLRFFLGVNQLLDHTNYPILNIGGVTKSFNFSYEYNGNYFYGIDIQITEGMNLVENEYVPFTISNIFLENGKTLPNLTREDIVGTTILGVTYDNTAPIVSGVSDEEIYHNETVTPIITDANIDVVTLNNNSFASGTEISEAGQYTLFAKDKSRNETIVTFEIVVETANLFKNDLSTDENISPIENNDIEVKNTYSTAYWSE